MDERTHETSPGADRRELLKKALQALEEMQAKVRALERARTEPIAIIGMGCRLPGGVDSPEAFWRLLSEGVDAITEVPVDRWSAARYTELDPTFALTLPALRGGFLDHVDRFDPQFFGIAPREALSMDPQQRLALEVSWEALEDAGYNPTALSGSATGVFIGITGSDYWHHIRNADPQHLDVYIATGNAHNGAAGRISFVLGLQGPSLAVDTACSSSLASIHLACQSLRLGESDLALAGGVNTMHNPDSFFGMFKWGMTAADGRCKTFDESADGFVRSEGCGVLVLKRLSDAMKDGDRIAAVIRGSAMNQDGASSGFTVPNGFAQEAVIRQALRVAGVNPAEVSYVEAHGTGTSLGDPIELEALDAVLGEGRTADNRLIVGSVKTNVGHLESAAGVAGVMKVVLSLQHEQVPPHLHFTKLNSRASFRGVPPIVPVSGLPWRGERRVAGVSSFGISGTNLHVIIESAPEQPAKKDAIARPVEVVTLSAKSEGALREQARRWQRHLSGYQNLSVADLARSANVGRAQFAHRSAIVASSISDVMAQLDALSRGDGAPAVVHGVVRSTERPRVAFLFTSQGSQDIGMGRSRYESEPVFKRALDECDALLRPHLGASLLSILYPPDSTGSQINETAYTQPALFAIEYALAQMWQSWGVSPSVVLGHSVGEYAAACVAGVFSLEDATGLIAKRARLMQELPRGGAMAAVFADCPHVESAIARAGAAVSIAADNGPAQVTIAGPADDVARVVATLDRDGVRTVPLSVSHAFHSALLDPMLDALEKEASTVRFSEPRMAVISNLTGRRATTGELTSAAYWRRHARETVRFRQGIEAAYEQGCRIFLEIGPAPALTGLGQTVIKGEAAWLLSLRRDRDACATVMMSLAELHVRGVEIDWRAVAAHTAGRPVALPTYPFERQRFWIESNKTGGVSDSWKDWLYDLEWKPKATDASVRLPLNLAAVSSLASNINGAVDSLSRQERFDSHASMQTELETLCAAYASRALESLAGPLQVGASFSTEEIKARGHVLDKHSRLLGRLLEILNEDGVLTGTGSRWGVTRALESPDLSAWAGDLMRRFPEHDAEIGLTAKCGAELAEVMAGRTNPMELLFPGGSFEQLERIYRDAPGSQVYNTLIQQTVKHALEGSPRRRRVRILEIGAGTGSTAGFVIPTLDPGRSTYTFTDLSNAFLDKAAERFQTHSFVEYRLLDIGQPPEAQGFEPHSFDIIIASHVLHATPDIRRTLAHVNRLLAGDGVVILFETTVRPRFLDLTFGMTDGWWSYTDIDLRSSHPLLSSAQWTRALAESGFEDASAAGEIVTGVNAGAALILGRGPQRPIDAERPVGDWLILSDTTGFGARLASDISRRGGRAIVAEHGDRFEEISGDRVIVDAQQPDHYRRLIAAAVDRGMTLRGVVHLASIDNEWPADAGTVEIDRVVRRSCGSALSLTQAVLAAGLDPLPRLVLATRGTQAFASDAHQVATGAGMLWGLSRSVAREHPELRCTAVDLDSTSDVTAFADDVLIDESHENQVALRDGERFVLRVTPSRTRSTQPSSTQLCRADGSYLVTGGLSGVGLLAAQRLVEQGARRVVLTGRSQPTEDARRAIGAMESAGATVVIVRGSVADRAAVEAAISTAESTGLRLAGLVHSAGTLDDAMLQQQTWDRFRTVMEAKVQGAWNLHAAAGTRPLDFFVLFSSTAAVFGPAGQSNHAAVNAFLDWLAHYRRSRGLAGLSINWGPWSRIGAAVRVGGTIDRARTHGIGSIDPESGAAAFEHLLRSGATQTAVLQADWATLRTTYAGNQDPPLLSDLPRRGARQAVAAATPSSRPVVLKEQLESAPLHQRWPLLLSHVSEQAAQVLGIDPATPLDPSQGLRDCGLDSLMALELRNRLQQSVGKSLRSTLAFDFPTIEAVARHLAQDVLAIDLAERPADEAASLGIDDAALDPDDLLMQIEQLSDEQAERLLMSEAETEKAR